MTLPLDPPDIGIVQRLLPNGTVMPLEMQRVVSTAILDDCTYLKKLVLQGGKSPVEIYTDEFPLTFVVTCLRPLLLPTRYQLHPVVSYGTERVVNLDMVTGFGNAGSAGIALHVLPYGPESYRLIPARPLDTGEYLFKYGLSADESKDVYSFRVVHHRWRPAPSRKSK